MNLQDEQVTHVQDEHQEQDTHSKPTATRVDDDGTVDEGSLKRNYFMGSDNTKDANAPGMEGEGMGGQSFGGTSAPPTGDDPANPSRNAGYSNAYFRRTEALHEDTANNNFKDAAQQGAPDYQSPTATTPGEGDKEKSAGEQGNTSEPGKADFKEEDLKGPDYGSNSPEIPGPGELPDQQKVGGA